MSGLLHPNVVTLVGFCRKPLSLVMEYLPDSDLFHFLREHPQLDWKTRISIALDVANGMCFLHSTSPPIIQRALKSVNILMKNTTAKVSDFGLSTVHTLTTKGRTVDNPFWLAPEVIRGEEATEKADVYSFGITLWEIVTGAQPFSEYNCDFLSHLEDRIVNDNLRPSIPVTVPNVLRRLIGECWKAEFRERPSFFRIVRRLQGMLSKVDAENTEKERLAEEYKRLSRVKSKAQIIVHINPLSGKRQKSKS